MHYNTIFIGAGISSLYSAYKHLKQNPNDNILILEKTKHIGGRVDWDIFENIEIQKGAGVGRFKKDKLLLELLIELDIPYKIINTSMDVLPLKDNLKELNINNPGEETFKDYALRILGNDKYNKFKKASGYSDYENFDAGIALKYYGFDDLYGKQSYFIFQWSKLIEKLITKLPKIHLLEEVTECKTNLIKTSKSTYTCDYIVIGTTINVLKKFFPKYTAYQYIESQPFIRIYAKLAKLLDNITYYTTDSPLQKIIHIKDNIYMIAYTDNANALYLKNLTKDEIEHTLKIEFSDPTIKILKYKKYFWKHGTHYYKPLPTDLTLKKLLNFAQHPMKNIKVIGEVVAKNQGWTGSALHTI
jgi:hypothetical protein